ncbi:hypothetical protein D3C78_1903610 [compost metagenome]
MPAARPISEPRAATPLVLRSLIRLSLVTRATDEMPESADQVPAALGVWLMRSISAI